MLLGNGRQRDEVLEEMKWLQAGECLLSLRSRYHSVAHQSPDPSHPHPLPLPSPFLFV